MRTQNLMWYRKLLTVLALLVFAGATAVAEVPTTPHDLYAGVSSDGQGGRIIDVVWMGVHDWNQGDNADGYYLYQSINSGAFSRVATVEAQKDGWGGYAQLPVTEVGTHTFYVIAYNGDGESEKSADVSVEVPSTWIDFQGEPLFAEVELGVEFTHTFTATASNGAEVRYAVAPGVSIHGKEVEATIDPVSGEFKTTIDEDGYYSFTVVAYLADDENIYAMTPVELKAGNGGDPGEPKLCTSISGSVVDSKGNPVTSSGYIVAFPADAANWFSGSSPIENGHYNIQLPAGSYRLAYQSERGEFFQFYPQTYEFDEATVIEAACDQEVTANFELLEDVDKEVNITVSGRVTRESDGSGVEAQVMFFDNSSLGCGSNIVTVNTDAEGNYEVELPIQRGRWTFSYTGMAMPLTDNGLVYEYFSETMNPDEAVAINESRSDVNFTLSGLPTFNNSISGKITDPENNAVEATVLAFSAADGDIFLPMFGMVDTRNGEYTLQNLQPGNYYIVVLPHDAFVPGYYAGIGQTVTLNWEEAGTVEVTETSVLTGVDMIVPTIEAEGINVVDGQINQASGILGGGGSKGDVVMGSEPLSGVMVYAIDDKGNVVGSAVSGQDGKFHLTGLGTGSYRIYADKIGYISYENTVSFDKPGSKQTVDVTMQANATTDVQDPVLSNVGFSTFPNPVTSQLSVRFSSLANTVRISVSDIAGKALITRDVQAINGDNTVQLDMGSLSAGAYIVTLKAENSVLAAPVTVVR